MRAPHDLILQSSAMLFASSAALLLVTDWVHMSVERREGCERVMRRRGKQMGRVYGPHRDSGPGVSPASSDSSDEPVSPASDRSALAMFYRTASSDVRQLSDVLPSFENRPGCDEVIGALDLAQVLALQHDAPWLAFRLAVAVSMLNSVKPEVLSVLAAQMLTLQRSPN